MVDTRGYTPLADYAVIGDCRSAALISRRGCIDWYCPERFDGPSVFAALLDRRRGGSFLLSPSDPSASSTHDYLPGTNVLERRHEADTGRARVVDFMPRTFPVGEQYIIRLIEGIEGAVSFQLDFAPVFNYGLDAGPIEPVPNGLLAECDGKSLRLWQHGLATALHPDRNTVAVKAGDRVALIVAPDRAADWVPDFDPFLLVDAEVKSWTEWLGRSAYRGRHRSLVERSLLTLRLLTYAPTGAPVAAPTTSLPEWVPGVRNWDYRYSWLRDSSLIVRTFRRFGFVAEAEDFTRWLCRVLPPALARRDLAVMYTVDGEEVPAERILSHLSGYADCRPVRVGNAARHQTQLDVFGDVVQAIVEALGPSGTDDAEILSLLRTLADEVTAGWPKPDQGIWEIRSKPRQFVYSKAMCWTALNSALAVLEQAGAPMEMEWRSTRDDIRQWILSKGYNQRVKAFVQSAGSSSTDAANLRLVALGLLPAQDERLVSTIAVTAEQLGTGGGLLRRYRSNHDDGVGGEEGAFVMVSFWLAQALAMSGSLDRAHTIFEQLVRYVSPTGLLAEEVDPSDGTLLGNYPQAFSHLGLLNAAATLEGMP